MTNEGNRGFSLLATRLPFAETFERKAICGRDHCCVRTRKTNIVVARNTKRELRAESKLTSCGRHFVSGF